MKSRYSRNGTLNALLQYSENLCIHIYRSRECLRVRIGNEREHLNKIYITIKLDAATMPVCFQRITKSTTNEPVCDIALRARWWNNSLCLVLVQYRVTLRLQRLHLIVTCEQWRNGNSDNRCTNRPSYRINKSVTFSHWQKFLNTDKTEPRANSLSSD